MKKAKIFFLVISFSISSISSFGQIRKVIMPDGNSSDIDIVLPDRQDKFVYTAESTKCIMWDEHTGKQLFSFSPPASRDITGMDISPDGKTLAVLRDQLLSIYNTQTGLEIPVVDDKKEHHYEDVKFADDNTLLLADYHALVSMNIKEQSITTLFKTPFTASISNRLFLLPNHQVLLANTHEALIIDANTWTQVSNAVYEPFKVTEFGPLKFDKITFLPKQQILVGYGSSIPVTFYNIHTGQLLRSIETDINAPVAIPSVNTNEIIISDLYQETGSRPLLLYNTDDFLEKKATKPLPVTKYPSAGGGYFNGALKKAWFISNKEVNVFETATKTTTHVLKGIIADWGLFQSESFEYISAYGRMNINTDRRNLKTIDLSRMVSTRHSELGVDPVALAVSGTGDTVALFDYKTVILKNVKTNKIIRPLTVIGSLDFIEKSCIFFSNDGKYLYYPLDGDNKKLMCRMNVATGIKQVLFTVRNFSNININRDKTLMIGNDETYQYCMTSVWNLITGAKLFTKDMTAEKDPRVLLSADEKKFKITGKEAYWIVDMASMKVIVNGQSLDVKADFEAPSGIMYSPDKKVFYQLQADNTLKVWEVATGRYIGILYLLRDSNDYVFMDDEGRFDGTPDGIKNLYLIVNRQPLTLDRFFERYYTPNLYQRLVNNEKLDPVPSGNINPSPKVKISYAQVVRNLNVVDDKTPAYANTTGVAEITVNASAENDKIDEIRLFHNGKIVNLATRGLFVTDNTTGTDTKKYTLNLLPGVNNIRAVALNGQRTESEPDEITVSYNNTGAANVPVNKSAGAIIDAVDRNATMHLVVVGINAYKNPKMSLNYALADATAFKDEAERDAHTMIANVKTYFVTDDKADKGGIIAALNEVQKNAKPKDLFVFYYAGHGVISQTSKEFYLVPNDVTDLKNLDEALDLHGIPAKMLQQYAIDIAAQKQVFILDACQSAGAFSTLLTNDANQQKSMAVVARSTGTHWIAASGSQQFANEFSQLGHGVFTYVLLKAMKGEAASNKMVTINGLKNYLQVQVPDLMKKYNGTPQYPSSYGLGDDFPVEVIK